MMQRLGRRYVACFNARYRRTGTLWEGRFKCSLIDNGRYLLTCYRYIELNPVRASMVSAPAEYRWSSYHCNACGKPNRLITPHPAYLSLGADPPSRLAAYRALFTEAISDDELADIRAHVRQQKALGTSRFQEQVEAQLARAVTLRPRGRPRKPVTILDGETIETHDLL
jgi:putative transposase